MCRQNTSWHAQFFSVLSCRACPSTSDLHTRMRVAQDVHRSCVVPLPAQKIISSHSTFHRTLLCVPDTFSSCWSSPPRTTPTSRPLTGKSGVLHCATSIEGRQSGYLAEQLLRTKCFISDNSLLGKPINSKRHYRYQIPIVAFGVSRFSQFFFFFQNCSEAPGSQHFDNKFTFADGTAKMSGRDYEFWETNLRRDQPLRREKLHFSILTPVYAQRSSNRAITYTTQVRSSGSQVFVG